MAQTTSFRLSNVYQSVSFGSNASLLLIPTLSLALPTSPVTDHGLVPATADHRPRHRDIQSLVMAPQSTVAAAASPVADFTSTVAAAASPVSDADAGELTPQLRQLTG